MIHSAAENSSKVNSRPDYFAVNINLGNFVTNVDEVVYLDVDSVSTVIGAVTSTANPVPNIFQDMEIVIDIPQSNSYDTRVQTQTRHICMIDRDISNYQTANYVDASGQTNPQTWQSWGFKHKPSRIALRPEVFQNKRWTINLRFIDGTSIYDKLAWISDYMLVFSVSK